MNVDPSEPMDSSLLQLERELFSLTPSEPDRRISARIESEIFPPVQIQRRSAAPLRQPSFQWKRVVVPAAAAVAVVAAISRNDSSPVYGRNVAANAGDNTISPAAANRARMGAVTLQPVSQSREFRSARDQGLVFGEGNNPSRAFSLETTDHHFWRNEQDNSSIQLSIPRQESMLVPVNFH